MNTRHDSEPRLHAGISLFTTLEALDGMLARLQTLAALVEAEQEYLAEPTDHLPPIPQFRYRCGEIDPLELRHALQSCRESTLVAVAFANKVLAPPRA